MVNLNRKAIITLTPELICKLLQLPDGVVVRDSRLEFEQPGTLQLLIEGAGWIVPEGAHVEHATVPDVFDVEEALKVDWHLPAEIV